jgi:hypothetical protein
MAMSTKSASKTTVTRADLEAKFRSIQEGVQSKVESTKPNLVAAGAAAGFLVLVIFYLLGRRSGKKRTTVVEIRRL